MKNKKGWMEIIEAFTAMLLIVAVILILLNKNYSQKDDFSERAYDTQVAMLREIELNDDLRTEILSTQDSDLPLRWDNINFPQDVINKIRERTPSPFTCIAMICNVTSSCRIDEGLGRKEVYVQSVLISPTPSAPEVYRRLKLFCYI